MTTTPDLTPIDAPPSIVKWRVQGKSWNVDGQDRCNWVAYLSASQVAGLLDKWVARWGGSWSDSFQPGDGMKRSFCTIAVRLPDGEWVSRTDIGTRPDTEGDKGLVSDAFKRCGIIKWGAGRNVYELPTVVAPVTVRRSGDKEYLNPNEQTRRTLARVLEAHGFTEADIDTDETVETTDAREPDADRRPEPERTPEPTPESQEIPGQQHIPGTNGGAEHHLSGAGTLEARRKALTAAWRELQRVDAERHGTLRSGLIKDLGVTTAKDVNASNVDDVEARTRKAQPTP